jgi:hypothetical protein
MGLEAVADPAISGAWERLGVAGILVIAGYFLIRYFMSELAKKDTRLSEVTDRFLAATHQQTVVMVQQTTVMVQFTEVLRELRDAVKDNK